MLFNSFPFLLAFLPLVVIAYDWCEKQYGRHWSKAVLLLACAVFAAYSGLLAIGVLAGSTIVNYLLVEKLREATEKKTVLFLSVGFNVLLLCCFKYAHSVANLMSYSVSWMSVALPLGISFYTFQQIAYLVDTYRGETERCTLWDYALFISFFPKLVQGPIVMHRDLMPQLLHARVLRPLSERMSQGLWLFAIGLSKKVLVADQFGKIVDFGYGHISSLNRFEAVLTILAYTFQIYFDFSGYCDMVCGVAKTLGFELPQNFNSPYKARNIADFWKRWHMTLTGFLTKYIYIPLGGNRRGAVRTYTHIMIVYLVSGLWHGTGVTFLVWGILHGAATVAHRIFRKPYEELPVCIQWLITFAFVNVAWVFFRANTMGEALNLLRAALFADGSLTINPELAEILLQPTLISVVSQFLPLPFVVLTGCSVALGAVLCLQNSNEKAEMFRPTLWNLVSTYVLLMLSVLSFSGVSTFLYSNF